MKEFKFFQKEQVKGTIDNPLMYSGSTFNTSSFYHQDTHGNREEMRRQRMRIEDEERAYRRFGIGKIQVKTVESTLASRFKRLIVSNPLKTIAVVGLIYSLFMLWLVNR
jgi:hypothetical protein